MKILVLTYNLQHRKTQDLLLRMKALGIYSGCDVLVLGTEYEPRRTLIPLLVHRPNSTIPVHPPEFCRNLGYTYISGHITRLEEINPDLTLIGGAGIIPEAITKRHCIINCHPGYLPHCRGLDALKWGLFDNDPIGVTLHRISAEPDSGHLIEQRITPIIFGDTFHAIAWRHYEAEINLLAEAVHFDCHAGTPIDVGQETVHHRMGHALEIALMRRLEYRLAHLAPEVAGNIAH